jgi:hypothetical protein
MGMRNESRYAQWVHGAPRMALTTEGAECAVGTRRESGGGQGAGGGSMRPSGGRAATGRLGAATRGRGA